MRIGIDIDGCLNDVHTFFIDEGIKFKLSKGEKQINFNNENWDFDRMFDFDEIQKEEFMHDAFAPTLLKSAIRENASEVIDKLSSEGNEIYIITSRKNFDEYFSNRGNSLYDDTIQWLSDNKVKYDKLIFGSSDKKESCIDNKIDIMIEDWGYNALKISKEIPVLMFKNTYNNEIKGDNIIGVYTWYDIYIKINSIKKQND